jgi:hypothetical protein
VQHASLSASFSEGSGTVLQDSGMWNKRFNILTFHSEKSFLN